MEGHDFRTFAWCRLATAAGTRMDRFLADCRVINRCISCILYILFIILHIIVLFTYKLLLCIQQEHDKQSGEGSRVCHRCYAKRNDFLSDVDVELKAVETRGRAIEKAEEVDEYNRRNPVMWIIDPSPMMVDITIMLLSYVINFIVEIFLQRIKKISRTSAPMKRACIFYILRNY